jgi:pimeloyl-ACP methyl ester carboxylesterase
VICPPFSAKKLADGWGGNAKLKLMDNAGHSAFEASIVPHLLRGLDAIYGQLQTS